MRRFIAFLAMYTLSSVASLTAQVPAVPPPATAADQFLGAWHGTLTSPVAELQLGLAVARDANGELHAAMTSLNQSGLTIPATASIHDDTLVVKVSVINGTYVAVVSGDSLVGTFSQGDKALPFDMVRVGPLAAHSQQEPEPPFPYHTSEVSLRSTFGVDLAGTLVIPQGTGPFPAVLLVPGSGPQDRNDSYVGHKPYLVLADYLARHGIASLRYDDRGVGKSTGAYAGATTADLATDAEAALHFLESNPAAAHGKVGIVGHSEGGLIGSMIAARSPNVAFLVLLATPGLPGDSVAMLQKRAVFENNKLDPVEFGRAMRFTRQVYDVAKSSEDSAQATAQIQALTRQYIASLSPEEQAHANEDGLAQSASAVTGPWFRYLLRYDPRPALRRVHVPVLAIGGTLDDQVPSRPNLAAIDTAVTAGGNRNVRIVDVPRVNHSLQTAVTGAGADASRIDETISPVILDIVTHWIAQQTTNP